MKIIRKFFHGEHKDAKSTKGGKVFVRYLIVKLTLNLRTKISSSCSSWEILL